MNSHLRRLAPRVRTISIGLPVDFKSGQVTAHYAAHGRDNGPAAPETPRFAETVPSISDKRH
jgi:hypothetical protein